ASPIALFHRHLYGNLMTAAFTPKGNIRAVTADGRVLDTSTGNVFGVHLNGRGSLTVAAVSPDGRYVIGYNSQEDPRLWVVRADELNYSRLELSSAYVGDSCTMGQCHP